MNLVHLKYAVEVAKTSSITKAAENLYMGQPNLSRAIKELESDLNITIFRRTSKGITPTPQGEEFLGYARSILSQVDAVQRRYREEKPGDKSFSISVPRASYIGCAFTDFVRNLDMTSEMEFLYKETNALRAIQNITDCSYRLGIIRYEASYDRYFKDLLEEKGLAHELVTEFRHLALVSSHSPLAQKEAFSPADLKDMIELAHGDPFVPSVPVSEVQKGELTKEVNKHIFVFERGSQLDLLGEVPNSFMWVSPVPGRILKKYDLVMRPCMGDQKKYKDMLIFLKNEHFTTLENRFIDELMKQKRHFPDN